MIENPMRIYVKNMPALPNFIPIRFKTTKSLGFFNMSLQEEQEQDE